MDLVTQKLELIELVLEVSDKELLEKLNNLNFEELTLVKEESSSYGSKSISGNKLILIQKILDTQSNTLISRINEFISRFYSEDSTEMKRMTMEEFNSAIDQSMDDFSNGRFVSSEELELKFEIEQNDKDRFTPMSLAEFHNRIEQSARDSENGRLTDSDKVFEHIGKWS